MIGVLLFVLKLILFIILFLLGFLLALLLIILLLPIKYEAYGHKYESLRLKARVFWLFRLLMVHVNIIDSDVDIIIKVCGFKIGKNDKASADEPNAQAKASADEPNAQDKASVNQPNAQTKASTDESNAQIKASADEPKKAEIKQEAKQEAKQEIKKEEIKKKEPRKKEPKKVKVKKTKVKKEKRKKDKKKQTDKESGFQKFKELYAFMTSEEQAGVFKFVLKRIKKILGSILPKKIKLYVHFGLDDPAMTGQILGAVSMFYPLYGQSVRLVPNFTQIIFEGEGYIKGRIIIGYILYQGLRVYFDKRIKAIIKKFKNA